jgi:hypothetical protein
MDLTTLAGDDTEANVHRLAFKAGSWIKIMMVAILAVIIIGNFKLE